MQCTALFIHINNLQRLVSSGNLTNFTIILMTIVTNRNLSKGRRIILLANCLYYAKNSIQTSSFNAQLLSSIFID